MKKTALFPGSFDPFTKGHKIIVDQGLKLFDNIIIGIGVNASKNGLLSIEQKIRLIEDVYKNDDRVTVKTFNGLMVNFCKHENISFTLRGMRNSVDFEYERNMMQINQAIHSEITTVLLFTPPEFVAISSSVIREIIACEGDPSQFMPEGININDYL